jgi:hypothetical protein
MSNLDIKLDNLQVSMAGEKNLVQFDADVSHLQQETIVGALAQPGMTCEIYPVDRQPG